MIALCLYSLESGDGKTALALALGRWLVAGNRRVSYWQPIGLAESRPTERNDTAFLREALDLAQESGKLAPLVPGEGKEAPDRRSLLDGLERSFAAASRGKDVVLVETSQKALAAAGFVASDLFEILRRGKAELRTVCVARYRDGGMVEQIEAANEACGGLAGLLINGVAGLHRWFVEDRVRPALAARNIPLIGVLPQNAELGTLTIRQLGEALGATVLIEGERGALHELFESVMFGSMSAEDARGYMSRKQNKLVISRGDHSDVHLAALGTSTRCLLLCGGYPSYPFVLDKAEELGVPVLSVDADIAATIEKVESLLVQANLWSPKKVELFEQLVSEGEIWSRLAELLDEN